jgi:SAM-dependent methyltransferase
MDIWKYFGITHRNHVVCNPTSSVKLDELIELLPLNAGTRVLDIACGKAELLLGIIDRYDATGVGVDISPYEVEEANRRVVTRNLEGQVEIVMADGADYSADPDSFDMAMCIGATWVWDGYLGTIEALKRIVAPGGLIAIGEPFKLKEPDPAHVATDPVFLQSLRTHAENIFVAQEAGLTLLYALVSNPDDWDRYEGLQTLAAETYALEHPDDVDVPELLKRRREADAEYLKWGRDTVNWAIYLFR